MHSHEGSLASISKDSGLMTSADLIGQQIHMSGHTSMQTKHANTENKIH